MFAVGCLLECYFLVPVGRDVVSNCSFFKRNPVKSILLASSGTALSITRFDGDLFFEAGGDWCALQVHTTNL